MHLALEEFQPNDGVDDDHEEDEKSNVEQGEHGLEDGVEDNLQACHKQRGGGRRVTPHFTVLCPPLYTQWDTQVRRGKGGLGRRDPVTHWAPLTPAGGV